MNQENLILKIRKEYNVGQKFAVDIIRNQVELITHALIHMLHINTDDRKKVHSVKLSSNGIDKSYSDNHNKRTSRILWHLCKTHFDTDVVQPEFISNLVSEYMANETDNNIALSEILPEVKEALEYTNKFYHPKTILLVVILSYCYIRKTDKLNRAVHLFLVDLGTKLGLETPQVLLMINSLRNYYRDNEEDLG